jgi:replication factor C large subunit
MAAAYDLDESHVSFITGSGETTNKVQSIVEDAQELREERMEEHSGSAFEGAVRGDDGDEDGTDGDDADDGQATLTGSDANDENDERGDETETDDSQSGLNDFF